MTLAALVGGCTVGPDYHPPETPVPGAFVGPQPTGAAIDPATWWTVFGDAMLDSLIKRALRDNPDIAIAASRVKQARLQEIIARANGKPIVNADANVTHIEFSKNAGFSSLARQFSGGGSGSGSGTGGTGGAGASGAGSSGSSGGDRAAGQRHHHLCAGLRC